MKKWFIFAAAAFGGLFILAALLTGPEPTDGIPAGGSAYRTGDRLEPAPRDESSMVPEPTPRGESSTVLEIGWADLIPPDWITDELLESLNLDEMEDSDPRAEAALQKIKEEWDRAPVVEELDGRKVRIPGFVVPLEGDGRTIREFLLVPYFGACVHVPPPPSNQLIHILPEEPIPGEWDMRPVWVMGDLDVTRFDSTLGNAGYQLRASSVDPYEEPVEEAPPPH